MKINLTSLLMAINLSIISISCPAFADDPGTTQSKMYDARQKSIYASQRCKNPKNKQYRGLTYEICIRDGKVTYGYGDGPPGDVGPSFYLKNGKLVMFIETGSVETYFFRNGELEADLVYGINGADKVQTKFTLAERKKITDRAVSYTNTILKVFGRKY